MKHVFIIGSKGIPARYGGFETFVEKLTEGQVSDAVKYHVACLSSGGESYGDGGDFEHNGAHCFNVKVPPIGSARAVYYDMAAFRYCNRYIEEHRIEDAVVYVLACRIGPFIKHYKKKLNRLGGKLYVNPDGHEWLRAKWNCLIRRYWRLSERLMVKNAQFIVCDSKNIEKYIRKNYAKYSPKTTYIAYGAEVSKSALSDDDTVWTGWCDKNNVKPKEYFLVVGRFVPENNYETMLREFMKSSTDKDFVLVTNIERNKFYEELRRKTGFDRDKRIKFVGTVYDRELLKKIREEAFGYLHGHEVGGTNPSLLEALAATDLNLLLDVGFNREVAGKSALYWSKEAGSLSGVLDKSTMLDINERSNLAELSTARILNEFSWEKIVGDYENMFLKTL